jgi:putative PIN family toxin of toxin-antitoxin system
MSESSRSSLRIVVDTNVFISGVIIKRGNPYALREAWHEGAFVLVLSPFQRNEIEEVLNRPKIAEIYALTLDERARLLHRLDSDAELVEPQTTIPVSLRDSKDVLILGTALAGNADYLVTGDKDLLAIASDPSLGEVKIVTVADFLPILGEHERSKGGDEDSHESEEHPLNGIDES